MKILAIAALAAALTAALPALIPAAVTPAHAHQPTSTAVGTVTVANPWSRATAPGAANGAGFLTITNTGTEADRLIAADSPAAAKAELHTHINDNGIMKMRPVEGIDLPPGQTVELRPGGFHVMLLGLKEPLPNGGHFPLTLTFAKAGAVTVKVSVFPAGAMSFGAAAGPTGQGAGPMGQGMGHGMGQHAPMKP